MELVHYRAFVAKIFLDLQKIRKLNRFEKKNLKNKTKTKQNENSSLVCFIIFPKVEKTKL